MVYLILILILILLSYLTVKRIKKIRFKDIQVEENPFSTIKTKIVGVTYRNDDGSFRQKVLSKCKKGDELFIINKPIKNYRHAMAVFNQKMQQLGHIEDELAKELYELFNKDKVFLTRVIGIHGCTHDKPTIGCSIEIQIFNKLNQ